IDTADQTCVGRRIHDCEPLELADHALRAAQLLRLQEVTGVDASLEHRFLDQDVDHVLRASWSTRPALVAFAEPARIILFVGTLTAPPWTQFPFSFIGNSHGFFLSELGTVEPLSRAYWSQTSGRSAKRLACRARGSEKQPPPARVREDLS